MEPIEILLVVVLFAGFGVGGLFIVVGLLLQKRQSIEVVGKYLVYKDDHTTKHISLDKLVSFEIKAPKWTRELIIKVVAYTLLLSYLLMIPCSLVMGAFYFILSFILEQGLDIKLTESGQGLNAIQMIMIFLALTCDFLIALYLTVSRLVNEELVIRDESAGETKVKTKSLDKESLEKIREIKEKVWEEKHNDVLH